MKLYEFQGKELFRKFGIRTPGGTVCKKGDALPWSRPNVLKAQVLSGGRGKAGAVVLCNAAGDQEAALKKLFGMTLKGEPVQAVLAEERVEILHEYYLSIAFDGEARTPLFIASAAGGMDIEQVADEHPERILKLPFDSLAGPCDHHLRQVAGFLGTSRTKELMEFLKKLYRVWHDTNAVLTEVNPLVETPDGFVALDAKVDLDDDAEPLHRELFDALRREQGAIDPSLGEAKHDTITYVPLDGDIGMISDGAGTGMLTLDLLKDHGGLAADFCEMGGLTSPEIMYAAMERVMQKPGIRSLLIVLIGGFNRMDEMADGIVRYVKDHNLKIPIVVRLCGTMEAEGKKIMQAAGLPVYDNLVQAVRTAVEG